MYIPTRRLSSGLSIEREPPLGRTVVSPAGMTAAVGGVNQNRGLWLARDPRSIGLCGRDGRISHEGHEDERVTKSCRSAVWQGFVALLPSCPSCQDGPRDGTGGPVMTPKALNSRIPPIAAGRVVWLCSSSSRWGSEFDAFWVFVTVNVTKIQN